MKFAIQFFLNLFFFFIYAVVGLKGADELSLLKGTESDGSLTFNLSWNKFLLVFLFFLIVSFFSVSTTYAILRKRKPRLKEGESPFTFEGKDETPESIIDLIDDKAGRITVEPQKVKSKKKKKAIK